MKIKESTSGQNKINAELKKDVLNLNIKMLNLNKTVAEPEYNSAESETII